MLNRMRTTLDLPEDLLEEARRLLAYKSKTDTVVFSLRELVRRRRIEELKELAGKIQLDLELPEARRRQKSSGTRARRR
jgi:Arc/MetJ family transcription regulator